MRRRTPQPQNICTNKGAALKILKSALKGLHLHLERGGISPARFAPSFLHAPEEST